jgi:predicted membrane-bound mannosyltransferase
VATLSGVVFSFSARANPSQRAGAVFTLTLLLIYSLIPYKTPWLLLTPYVGLALLAGLGIASSDRWLPAKLAGLAPALLCGVMLLAAGWSGRSALGRYANDERNPYVYQPTSPDLTRLIAALPAGAKIAVVSPDHAWPLPWYLRDRTTVGYFATAPANLPAYDVVLLDSRLPAPPPATAAAYGLRPNVLLWRVPR